jgi:hypothetical protein
MSKVQITIEIEDDHLGRYPDSHLAMLWHVAQANPAPHADKTAGRLAGRIGREIIRRWLGDQAGAAVPPGQGLLLVRAVQAGRVQAGRW